MRDSGSFMENVLHQVFISLKRKEYVLLWLCPSLQQAECYSALGERSPVKHCRAHRGKQRVNYTCNRGPLFFVAFIFFAKKNPRGFINTWGLLTVLILPLDKAFSYSDAPVLWPLPLSAGWSAVWFSFNTHFIPKVSLQGTVSKICVLLKTFLYFQLFC